MDIKWIGAVLIISACDGFGFTLSAAHRREEKHLKSLICALDFMVSELHFHTTALPELCRQTAGEGISGIGKVFSNLASELERNETPDVASCMEAVLSCAELPPVTSDKLHLLGKSLGRFDLDGQLKGLASVRDSCRQDLQQLTADREQRLRSYQTLSLCAGAALAILLV